MKIEQVSYTISGVTAAAGGTTIATGANELEVTVGIIAMIIGAFCALGTMIITWYYKEKNAKLAEKAIEHGIKLKEL